MPSSDDEATADSQHSTPPKKKRKVEDPKDFPSELLSFLSHAVFSNRTLACFAIYTTKEKAALLYKKIMEKYLMYSALTRDHNQPYHICRGFTCFKKPPTPPPEPET